MRIGCWRVLIVFPVLFLGCEESGTPFEDLPSLSGTWTGTLDVYQLEEECEINDGSHAQGSAQLVLQVDSTGIVGISEPYGDGAVWWGTVDENLEVIFHKRYSFDCPDSTYRDSAIYGGDIRKSGQNYVLTMSAQEMWCPPNCRFRLLYTLYKE